MALELDPALNLTKEEMKEGWHFCIEFDYLLTQGEEIDEQGRCEFCEFDKRLVK